jgi:hypothetical protein
MLIWSATNDEDDADAAEADGAIPSNRETAVPESAPVPPVPDDQGE